ncbi:MAG: hypothetical protein J5546_00745 [Lachnospiraceae bacterium]|nr:hypothetical protein [Lachnospiraceae bacterium]
MEETKDLEPNRIEEEEVQKAAGGIEFPDNLLNPDMLNAADPFHEGTPDFAREGGASIRAESG